MDNIDLQILRQVQNWRASGHRVVLGTIIRTWGSAPRPIGSVVAVRDDGQIAGSVSGGCIEDDLIERVREGALLADTPRTVRYGVSGDEAARFGLPCGGTIELVLEPVLPHSGIEVLLERLASGRRVRRTLDFLTGAVTLTEAEPGDTLTFDGQTLVSTHGPGWRLIVIGAGQMTQFLAEMGRALDYQVFIIDPRPEYADGFEVAGCQLVREMPDDALVALSLDAHCAVIALTHDPKLDDLALMEALRSPAFYVGAIGSRLNQAKRKQRLGEHFGLTEAELGRLHGPVGIKNGARTPPEIAVAILAEVTGVRYGYRIPEPVSVGGAAGVEAGCMA
ncbi:XdhC family protein [Leptothrix discophora]|uniref:XdhC family protein n=1 Tax=Leptothrix discophora TaxID=89 RepID=A0ABT9FZE6_LEPDI|nr:XdhC family protein [Leptothrix discophora]MDP4299607.1 XdhC family protein [Leptothrix discophora]